MGQKGPFLTARSQSQEGCYDPWNPFGQIVLLIKPCQIRLASYNDYSTKNFFSPYHFHASSLLTFWWSLQHIREQEGLPSAFYIIWHETESWIVYAGRLAPQSNMGLGFTVQLSIPSLGKNGLMCQPSAKNKANLVKALVAERWVANCC